MPQKVLIIVGPTASGKSSLAVELAHTLNGEIISADSRQVYKGLDIGTGKVTIKEMEGIPHHLLDVCSPKKVFSAGDYVELARSVIKDTVSRGKLPIVVGGTGFYIDALVGRIPLPDVSPNLALRKKLGSKTALQLFALLKKRDPVRATSMDTPSERSNKVRLVRALEIAHALGKVPTKKDRPLYDALWIGIQPSDTEFRRRINKRLAERLRSGMIAEAKRLHAGGLSYKRMEELGLEYRSLSRFLKKQISRKELELELQSDIWHYARKQVGYWKRNVDIKWFKPNDSKKIKAAVSRWEKV